MRNFVKFLSTVSLFMLPLVASADGEAVFSQQCASCHGKDGGGMQYVAPKLAGSEFVKTASAEEIAKTIRNGRAGGEKKYTSDFPAAMPPFTPEQVSDAELDELVAYLKGALQE